MLNLLNNGSDGMAKMRKEARDLGIVIDEDLIRSAEDAQTKLDLMSRVISANLNSALITLAPQLVNASVKFAEFIKNASDLFKTLGLFQKDEISVENLLGKISDMENFPILTRNISRDKADIKSFSKDVEKLKDKLYGLATPSVMGKLASIVGYDTTDEKKLVEIANLEKLIIDRQETILMWKDRLLKSEKELLDGKKKNADFEAVASNLGNLEQEKRITIEKLVEEARLKGLTNEERTKEIALIEKEIFLKRAATLIDQSDVANKNVLLYQLQELAQIHYDLQVAMGKTNEVAKESVHVFKEIETTITSSMEDAFMSMVDGTATVQDAFRSMAREIIKELYRVMVVQQLVGSFDSGTGVMGAIGSAFSIPTKAHGGTVGAGSPQIVGESGRELFVPQQAGRIMTTAQTQAMTSGGGGGGVVVNQTINVSTGVSQTVRTEIKSLMPQIAEGAKSAVLDAKRRGGSFGSAFA